MKSLYILLCLCLTMSTDLLAQTFTNELPIPPLALRGDVGFDIDIKQSMHNFNPDVSTQTVGTLTFEDFNNPGMTSILGPTIVFENNEILGFTVLNELEQASNLHIFGAHLPQSANLGPHHVLAKDSLFETSFIVDNSPSTKWYRPAFIGDTYDQTQMGLGGIAIYQDPNFQAHNIFPNTYGVDDFPLIFQTKKFNADGSIDITNKDYDSDFEYMVNGTINPYLNVPANMIRLRLVNGDAKFSFNYSLNEETKLQLVSSEGGQTDRTYGLANITLAPGETADILLDLRGRNGNMLAIRSIPSNLPAGSIGSSLSTTALIELRVGDANTEVGASPIISFPIELLPSNVPAEGEVTRSRTKAFEFDGNLVINPISEFIDGINDIVKLDSTEQWTIENSTDESQSWYIDNNEFYVVSMKDENDADISSDFPHLINQAKHNILIPPGHEYDIRMTFADYGTEQSADSIFYYQSSNLVKFDEETFGTFVIWNGNETTVSVDADPSLSSIPMTVYPNPAEDYVYLEGESKQESVLRFVDMNGRLIKQINVPSFKGALRIPTADLPTSMLMMEWLTEEGKAVSKVVVN